MYFIEPSYQLSTLARAEPFRVSTELMFSQTPTPHPPSDKTRDDLGRIGSLRDRHRLSDGPADFATTTTLTQALLRTRRPRREDALPSRICSVALERVMAEHRSLPRSPCAASRTSSPDAAVVIISRRKECEVSHIPHALDPSFESHPTCAHQALPSRRKTYPLSPRIF